MEGKTLYEILDVSQKASQDEICHAYRELIKRIHPDKKGSNRLMQIVNKAYQILKNPLHRFEYDKSLRIIEKNHETKKLDFNEMKKSAMEFLNTQKSEASNEQKFLEAKKRYDTENAEANRKIGYTSEECVVDEEQFKQQYNQFMQLREQEDIENMPTKKFDKTPDNKTFNAVFDKLAENSKSLIKYTGEICPFDGSATGCNINEEQEHEMTDISGNNLDTFIITPKVDFKQHKSIDELMKEHEDETKKLNKMKTGDFTQNEIIGMDGKTIKHS